MRYPEITACVFNYNGFREPILKGKGRIQTTIESLLETVPEFAEINVLFIDNESTDGSNKYLEGLGFGEVVTIPRVIKETSWQASLINTTDTIKQVLNIVDTPYLWRIEDDSYFYNSQNFLQKAIDVFECDEEVNIIHLRRWTSMDAKDLPGQGRNLNRISDKRISVRGDSYFIIEKLENDTVWVPIEDDLGSNFVPDKETGFNKHPLNLNKIGSLRKNKKSYEKLVRDKWATYSHHGWVCKKRSLEFLFATYTNKILEEGDLSYYFKKHFRAAKLDQDAFIAFGWRTRNINWTEDEVFQVFNYAKKYNISSSQEFGIFR